MPTESPLYRRLSAAPRPLIALKVGDIWQSDTRITHWSATHGSGNAEAGYTPGTFTFERVGDLLANLDTVTKCELTPGFSKWIEGRTGTAPIRTRFIGRTGAVKTADNGSRRERTVTVSAASWATLLRKARRKTTAPTASALNTILRVAFEHPRLSAHIPVTTRSTDQFDIPWLGSANLDFDDTIRDYGTKRGVFCIQQLDGTVNIVPLKLLAEELGGKAESSPAVLRSQVLTPAEWSQPLDERGASLRILARVRATATSTYAMNWPQPAGSSRIPLEYQDEDWGDIDLRTGNHRFYMDALNHRVNAPRTGITSITVDMGALLSSDRKYDHVVAGHLLTLNETDPLFLGGDWPTAIRGPMVITRISETMTPEHWRITFSLDTVRNVFGLLDADAPTVPPRVWDHFNTETWNTTPRSWEAYS